MKQGIIDSPTGASELASAPLSFAAFFWGPLPLDEPMRVMSFV